MEWHELFEYDPTSPTFLINKVFRSPKAMQGQSAGTVKGKEIKVRYNGKFYRNARIIWEMHNGPIPENYFIRFADGNEFNLLLENLSLQSARERGVRSHQPVGQTGHRGISEVDGKWLAHAKINGVSTYLGTYRSCREAVLGRRRTLRLMKV